MDHRIALADVKIELIKGGDTAGNKIFLNLNGDIRQVQVVSQNLAVVSKLHTHRGEEQLEPSHSSPADDQQIVRAMASKGTGQRYGLTQTLRSLSTLGGDVWQLQGTVAVPMWRDLRRRPHGARWPGRPIRNRLAYNCTYIATVHHHGPVRTARAAGK